MTTTSALVCDLTKLSDDQRARLIAISAEVFRAASEVRVLPDGFELAYPDASPELISKMAEFIAYDRLCCAFLEHSIVSSAHGAPALLRITGGEGAKEVIAADLQGLISANTRVVGDLASLPLR